MYSLTEKKMISKKAMTIICSGLVLPSSAPNVMRTAAAAKSAVSRLQTQEASEAGSFTPRVIHTKVIHTRVIHTRVIHTRVIHTQGHS